MTTSCVTQTTGPVTFDYDWWAARYPELAAWAGPERASDYFIMAQLYLDNTDGGRNLIVIPGYGVTSGAYAAGSPVTDIPTRQVLFGLLTAHIAALNAPLNGQVSSTVVGRVSSASEGSVSVSFDYPTSAGSEWYNLTKYGAAFWAATARYRMARYYPAPRLKMGFRGGRGYF